MHRCLYCGGTPSMPDMLRCNVCYGVGTVLSLVPNNPWLDFHAATATNKLFYINYYEHICPQCHGSGGLLCNSWFHN